MGKRLWRRWVATLFGALAVLMLLAGLAIPPYTSPGVSARRASVVQDAWNLAKVAFAYATDHDGNYPDSLDVLVEQNYLPAKSYKDLLTKYPALTYTKPTRNASDETTVVAIPIDGGTAVAFKGGYARFERSDQSSRSAQ